MGKPSGSWHTCVYATAFTVKWGSLNSSPLWLWFRSLEIYNTCLCWICSHPPSCHWWARFRWGGHLHPAATTPADWMVCGYWRHQPWRHTASRWQPTQEQVHRKCPEQCGLQQSTGEMTAQSRGQIVTSGFLEMLAGIGWGCRFTLFDVMRKSAQEKGNVYLTWTGQQVCLN